jgi:hypothetical protein
MENVFVQKDFKEMIVDIVHALTTAMIMDTVMMEFAYAIRFLNSLK